MLSKEFKKNVRAEYYLECQHCKNHSQCSTSLVESSLKKLAKLLEKNAHGFVMIDGKVYCGKHANR